MPEMHLKQPEFTYSALGNGQNIFTEMNWIKFVFNMIWVMEILKI